MYLCSHIILSAATGSEAYSASNRNEYQRQIEIFVGSTERPVREADNCTAICESIV
jgi:hypothetical protein